MGILHSHAASVITIHRRNGEGSHLVGISEDGRAVAKRGFLPCSCAVKGQACSQLKILSISGVVSSASLRAGEGRRRAKAAASGPPASHKRGRRRTIVLFFLAEIRAHEAIAMSRNRADEARLPRIIVKNATDGADRLTERATGNGGIVPDALEDVASMHRLMSVLDEKNQEVEVAGNERHLAPFWRRSRRWGDSVKSLNRYRITLSTRGEALSGIVASRVTGAQLIPGGRCIRLVVEEDAIVDVHPAIVGWLDVLPGKEVSHRPKRYLAINSQPVLKRKFVKRSGRIPNAALVRLRFYLCGAVLLEPAHVRPDHVNDCITGAELLPVEIYAVRSRRVPEQSSERVEAALVRFDCQGGRRRSELEQGGARRVSPRSLRRFRRIDVQHP
jgi:hypothetical protein